jgi:hypothetical protein
MGRTETLTQCKCNGVVLPARGRLATLILRGSCNASATPACLPRCLTGKGGSPPLETRVRLAAVEESCCKYWDGSSCAADHVLR